MISKIGLHEFKELVQSELGIELTNEQVADEAANFLNLFKNLQQARSISPISKDPIVKPSKKIHYET